VSRTNHHRRNYKLWNITETEYHWGWKREPRKIKRHVYQFAVEPREWIRTEEQRQVGMETWDLRFYAGCRRRPQVIHRVLDFGTAYPWRFHHGTGGTARICADIHERQFRTDTRRYVDQARAVWNAGGDVDEVREPGDRPRSIEWDLW
jgi:hypothetical protein